MHISLFKVYQYVENFSLDIGMFPKIFVCNLAEKLTFNTVIIIVTSCLAYKFPVPVVSRILSLIMKISACKTPRNTQSTLVFHVLAESNINVPEDILSFPK
jgi:hypothetical protein